MKSRQYRLASQQQEVLKREVDRMLELKLIEPRESTCPSPTILLEVPCKDPRPCVDYRKLNATMKDHTCPCCLSEGSLIECVQGEPCWKMRLNNAATPKPMQISELYCSKALNKIKMSIWPPVSRTSCGKEACKAKHGRVKEITGIVWHVSC